MTANACCAQTIPLSRPLHERALDALYDKMRDFRLALKAQAEERSRQRELQAVADMNELLLKDIGAPEWMIASARARREADQQVLVELRQGGLFRG